MEIILPDWDNEDINYELDLLNKEIRQTIVTKQSNRYGFVKKFLKNKLIAVYKAKNDEEKYFFWYGKSYNLEDLVDAIEWSQKGPVNTLTVNLPNGELQFKEIKLLSYFQQKFDPTYDYIDASTDYFYIWLKERFNKLR